MVQASPNRHSATLAARTLKLVGAILILSSLLDYLVLSFPIQPLNLQWRLQFVTQVVERGIIPAIGLTFIFVGNWVSRSATNATSPSGKLQDPNFWCLILASLLGFFFLVLAPIHFRDVNRLSGERLQQIETQANQAEQQVEQLESQLGTGELQEPLQQQIEQQKQQITALLEDEERFNQFLEQAPEEQQARLQEFKENPESLDQFLNQQAEQLPTNLKTQIRLRQENLQSQTRLSSMKSGFRIGLSSLLLAIGYIAIGWTGLKGMMRPRRSGRRAPSARRADYGS